MCEFSRSLFGGNRGSTFSFSPSPSSLSLGTSLVQSPKHPSRQAHVQTVARPSSMLRRPSGSTDEDEPESRADATRPASRDSKKEPFTSAKFDATRHSDTLDRRKAEKDLNKTSQAQWSASNDPPSSDKKKERDQQTSQLPAEKDKSAMDITEWRRPRLRSPWKCSLLTLATTAASVLLLLSIVNSFLTRHLDPKGCKNCLMRPIFGKFEGFDTEHTRFASKYSLHLYREGGVNEDMSVR